MYIKGTRQARQVRSGVSGDRSPRGAKLLRGYVSRTRFPRRRVDLTGQQVSLGARGLGEQRAGNERSDGEILNLVSAGKGPMPTRQCENAREAGLYSP